MHQRVKEKKGKTPLLVKEIVLPLGRDNSRLSKNSTCCNNDEGSHKTTGHSHTETGQCEVEEVLSLKVVQEKPLENYFEGSRKKKNFGRRKRKGKHNRIVVPPSELFSDGTQTLSSGERKQTVKVLTEEEKTEIHLLDLKIYEYEKMREQARKKNYVKQKMAEEDYICQLENLVAMWFKTERRRHVTRKVGDDFVLSKSFPKETPNKRTTKISFNSGECCKKNPESPLGKSKKVLKKKYQAQPADNVLGDEFNKKLVFVDEDSDEYNYNGQNLQFRSSRKFLKRELEDKGL